MSQPLNATDAALWDIERDPTLRTTIVGVLELDRPIDHDRLLNDLEAATRTIPKLRQRVKEGPAGMGTPQWELIEDFDITDRVTFVDLHDEVDWNQVADVAERLASTPLDRSGALWSCTYMAGPSGGAALVMKVHHSLTDGVGGIELLDVMLELDRPIDHDRLLNDLEAATRTIPKLRQRVKEGPAGMGTPQWELIEDFDITDRVTFVDLHDEVDWNQVAEVAERLASTPLDRSGALWSCTYMAGPSGGAALVMKVHHSLTDGVGGIELLDVMLDADPDAPARDLETIETPRPHARVHPLVAAAHGAQSLVELQFDVAKTAGEAAIHPMKATTGVIKGVQSTLRLLNPTSSTMSTLMKGRSADRSTRIAQLDLERLHDAAHRHGFTINHLLFASIVHAVARYHEGAGHALAKLRVLMPVSFRSADDDSGGNQWGPVRFTAPADIDDHLERLMAMREVLDTSRKEPALKFSQSLAGVVQLLPSALSSSLIGGMMHGVDVVVTNIPGLTEERFMCGARVETVHAFAPTAGAALNVALVSHLGRACIGILSDDAAVEDPDLLCELVEAALTEVVDVAEQADPLPPMIATNAPSPASAGGASRRLSALDTAFLRLESPAAPMHLGGIIVLDGVGLRDDDGRIRIETARRHIEARLVRVPQFRCRIAEVPLDLGRPVWVDDEHFDIERHVRLISVPQPGGRQELLDLAATLHESLLDRTHPMWELWFVDGMPGGEVAVIEKLHHAMVDGIGGVELISALFDFEPRSEPDLPVRVPTRGAPGSLQLVAGSLAEQLADPLRLAGNASRRAILAPEQLVNQARTVGNAVRDLLRPSASTEAASFNRPIERRRVLRQVRCDLDWVHEFGRGVGASVNDVVLAAIAGALRDWMKARGDTPFDLHALVPVSVRHDHVTIEPGNRVGAVLVTLPVLEPDIGRRLQQVTIRMQRYKRAHEGEGLALALDVLDHVPSRSLQAARLLANQSIANLVVTNVPGPREAMYFLEAEATEMTPILPLGPNMGLGVAVLSYRNDLTLSLFADPDSCPDLDRFAEALHDQFAAFSELD